MLIECPYCKAKVDARPIGSHEEFNPDIDPFVYRFTLLACPSCKSSLLGAQENIEVAPNEYQWSEPNRVWPSPKRYIPWSVPQVVRSSIEEAERCFNTGAYTASVAMSGRALGARGQSPSPY